MHPHPAVVDAHTSLSAAWGRLHGRRDRHLVVIDDGVRPIGVLDERDLARGWPPARSPRTASRCTSCCAPGPGRGFGARTTSRRWPAPC
ncbi:CBS domain-containing protein [Geodermatophilus telluris]|uniref:CBS domain-containing protein n=1 Tax=Geodermatophilus telluris TaxID=1190417 RepID=UPI003CCC0FA5